MSNRKLLLTAFALLLVLAPWRLCSAADRQLSQKWCDYGFDQLGKGQTAQALESFQKAVKADQGNPAACRGMAACKKKMGDAAGSKQWYQKAADLEAAQSVDGSPLPGAAPGLEDTGSGFPDIPPAPKKAAPREKITKKSSCMGIARTYYFKGEPIPREILFGVPRLEPIIGDCDAAMDMFGKRCCWQAVGMPLLLGGTALSCYASMMGGVSPLGSLVILAAIFPLMAADNRIEDAVRIYNRGCVAKEGTGLPVEYAGARPEPPVSEFGTAGSNYLGEGSL